MRRGRELHRNAAQRDRKPLAGEWPEDPPLSYYIEQEGQRDELCKPAGCPDSRIGLSPDGENIYYRCSACVVHKLDEMTDGTYGELVQAAVRWREVLNLGLTVRIEEIPADELVTLELLEQIYPRHGHQSNPTNDPTGLAERE